MPSARVAALRLLAQRRLTQSQLCDRLQRKGFADDAIAEAVASCKRDGLLDDALFAALYVESKRAALGDARLVGELVKRGIDRETARTSVEACETSQAERAAIAYGALSRRRPALSYQSAARKLERLGFPASVIYRILREHAGRELGDALADLA